MSRVRITVELSEAEAHQAHLLIKRLTFEDALEHTDAGQSREQRNEQAYAMLSAICKIDDALLEARA